MSVSLEGRRNSLALAGTAAVVSAVAMLLLGVFGTIGVYGGAVEAMEQWHLFFEPTIVGTVAGMVEAAVISFVLMYAFLGVAVQRLRIINRGPNPCTSQIKPKSSSTHRPRIYGST